MADETIYSTVGRLPALNTVHDQQVLQTLLNRVQKSHGGAEGSLHEQFQDGQVAPALQAAIDTFQRSNVSMQNRDGRVAPNGETMQKLKLLAGTAGPQQIPWQPSGSAGTGGTATAVALADLTLPGVPLYSQMAMGFPAAAAENACWWACIKMVRDTGGAMGDAPPPEMRNATKALDMLAIEAIYPRYQMYAAFPYPSPPTFTAAALVQALQDKGPMCACGRFAVGDQSTTEYDGHVQHAIVVYGVVNSGRVVVCNDPWRGTVRRVFWDDFNSRLHAGRSRLIAATKHIHNLQSVHHP